MSRLTAIGRKVNQARYYPRRTRGYQQPRHYKPADWGKDQYLVLQNWIPEKGPSPYGPAWNERKENELKRHGRKCQGCGWESENSNDFNNDHKTPIERGGTNNRCNLQILCPPCNAGKGNMTDPKWRAAGMPHKRPGEWKMEKYQKWCSQR